MPDPSSQMADLTAAEKRQLVAQLLQQRATQHPPETYQFEQFPEIQQLRQQQTQLQSLGIRNPFFSTHEGTTAATATIEGREFINFATYNYLGLAGHSVVSAAAQQAIEHYGTSVSASRPASGQKPLHLELEGAIAAFLGVEDCITYVAGYTTNVATISHLLGPQDLILYDALSHNSVFVGCQLSGARAIAFPHNDSVALEQLLQKQRAQYRRTLIVIEGVYSADGDIPDLPAFVALKQQYQALLMVDEAHSIGVLGQRGAGISDHFGVDPQAVDLWMGTLSKSFASCGGYIAGSHALVDYLKCTSPGFIYSIGMSPPNAASALAALQILQAEPERVQDLQLRSRFFLDCAQAHHLNTGRSCDSAIIPIIVGETFRALHLCQLLFEQGINVQPMTYPVVPPNEARLRFFISGLHTEAQLAKTVETLAHALTQLPNNAD